MSQLIGAADQPIASYYYDPFGRRLWKILQPGAEGHSGTAGPETTYLAYSDEGYAAEFTLPGTPAEAPAAGPTAGQYTSLWLYAPQGTWSTDPIANKTLAGWRYLQTDHLGTPQLAITNTGSASTQRRMAAFGSTREQGERLSSRFPGQLEDRESGSYYNYFRDYEPATGRYAESDPIGLGGGMDTYGYSQQSPLIWADPLGLKACKPCGVMSCCLAVVFGVPESDVKKQKVTDNSRYAKLHFIGQDYEYAATTRPNRMFFTDDCEVLWADPWFVLHEYAHLINQWAPRRLTRAKYLRSPRPWEDEANKFANENFLLMLDCLSNGCGSKPTCGSDCT